MRTTQEKVKVKYMKKVETTTSSPTSTNAVLAADVVSKIADQYEEQVRLEQLYRENIERKIKELEQSISNSRNKLIYKLLYKAKYGDYRQFVEQVAEELRRRNACH